MKTPKSNSKSTDKASSVKPAYGIKPENTLRKKIGTDVLIQNILTPEKIKECQEIIVKAHGDLFADSLDNLTDMEAEYKKADIKPGHAKSHVHNMAKLSFVLKGRLEALGMTLGYDVSKSLYDYANNHHTITPETMLVMRKHLDVLSIVMKEKIGGDGGAIGQEMLDGLIKLVKKIQ